MRVICDLEKIEKGPVSKVWPKKSQLFSEKKTNYVEVIFQYKSSGF